MDLRIEWLEGLDAIDILFSIGFLIDFIEERLGKCDKPQLKGTGYYNLFSNCTYVRSMSTQL